MSSSNSDQFAEHVAMEIQWLRQFDAFTHLPCWALIPLASAAQLKHYDENDQICALGDESDEEFFLLHGTVLLTAADGRTQQVEGGGALASKPLALLRPRKYELYAKTPCKLLTLDQRSYRNYVKEATELSDEPVLQNDADLYSQFQQDLNQRRITLSTHPLLAAQAKAHLAQRSLSVDGISQLLMNTPAIALDLMRLANSPLFESQGPCQNLTEMIERLGVANSQALIRIFCEHSLAHDSSPALLELNQRLHRDALEMAALCCVIARRCPEINVEVAALIGLWHNIGLTLVEDYLNHSPQFADLFGDLENISRKYGSRIGQELMLHWHLPEFFCKAQSNLCNWSYHSLQSGDYSSLLICAQAHHHLMHPEIYRLPPIDQIPALSELSCGRIEPRESVEIIQQAKRQLQQFALTP